MKKQYFVTGIGTGIGKTIVSAVLTEKLKCDYWKPIQSGDLHDTDSMKVSQLISNELTIIHPERYRLMQPLSPHLSAKLDDIQIDLNAFRIPETNNGLIIEGAGGLMVPLNDKHLILDLIIKLNTEVILVSSNYLGSINHTLLSVNTLQQHNIPVKGIIFSGPSNEETERYILNYTGITLIGHVPQLEEVDKESIRKCGEGIRL